MRIYNFLQLTTNLLPTSYQPAVAGIIGFVWVNSSVVVCDENSDAFNVVKQTYIGIN
jgi:hypothetical protein